MMWQESVDENHSKIQERSATLNSCISLCSSSFVSRQNGGVRVTNHTHFSLPFFFFPSTSTFPCLIQPRPSFPPRNLQLSLCLEKFPRHHFNMAVTDRSKSWLYIDPPLPSSLILTARHCITETSTNPYAPSPSASSLRTHHFFFNVILHTNQQNIAVSSLRR